MSVMTRLHLHHTGGAYTANGLDRRSYHRLAQGDGSIISGQFSILDNAPGRIKAGQYAAHTLSANTGAIGLSLCAMLGGQWSNPFACETFPKVKQVDAFIEEAARLCRTWDIPVTRRTVLTHAEIQITLGIRQNAKWDFDYDPYGVLDSRDPLVIGDMLREKIIAILDVLPDVSGVPSGGPITRPQVTMPTVRQGMVRNEAVRVLQAALGLAVDGAFGPKTLAAVVAYQRRHQLSPDGIVGPATWTQILSQKQ